MKNKGNKITYSAKHFWWESKTLIQAREVEKLQVQDFEGDCVVEESQGVGIEAVGEVAGTLGLAALTHYLRDSNS